MVRPFFCGFAISVVSLFSRDDPPPENPYIRRCSYRLSLCIFIIFAGGVWFLECLITSCSAFLCAWIEMSHRQAK